MPPALTPALALDYVHELSADVRAGAILDATGELLAGDAALTDAARALLGAAGDAGEVEAANADGVVCAVRTTAHTAVAVCGRFAIAGVVRQDLRAALAALEGCPPSTRAALEGRPPSTRAALEGRPPSTRAALEGRPPSTRAALEGCPPSTRAARETRPPAPRAAPPGVLSEAAETALTAAANRLITAVQRQFGG